MQFDGSGGFFPSAAPTPPIGFPPPPISNISEAADPRFLTFYDQDVSSSTWIPCATIPYIDASCSYVAYSIVCSDQGMKVFQGISMEFTVYSFCDGTPMGQGSAGLPVLPVRYGEPGGCTQTPQPAYKKGAALFKQFAKERCGYAELDEHVPFSCASPGSNTGHQQNFTGGPAIALAIDVAQPPSRR